MNQDTEVEVLRPYTSTVDFSKKEYLHLTPEIKVPGVLLGSEKWNDILQKTDQQQREFGLVVSLYGQKPITSKVISGDSHSFTVPFLAHGIKSIWLPQDITLLHSHPNHENVRHLRTTFFTDDDINNFLQSSRCADVMIDKGGVHVLISNRRYSMRDQEIPRTSVATEALYNDKNKSTLDVMRQMGERLAKDQVFYYYTPSHEVPIDGMIHLYDVRSLNTYPQ